VSREYGNDRDYQPHELTVDKVGFAIHVCDEEGHLIGSNGTSVLLEETRAAILRSIFNCISIGNNGERLRSASDKFADGFTLLVNHTAQNPGEFPRDEGALLFLSHVLSRNRNHKVAIQDLVTALSEKDFDQFSSGLPADLKNIFMQAHGLASGGYLAMRPDLLDGKRN